MSDTHGNVGLMFEVADLLTKRFAAAWIYHAGDDYVDAETLDHAGYKVRAVPGLWCSEYSRGRVPRHIVDHFDGVSIAMAHAEKDLRGAALAADVVITGHTHRARLERLGGSIHLNPGHLKAPTDRGERASFAVLDIAAGETRASIFELDGSVRDTLTLAR